MPKFRIHGQYTIRICVEVDADNYEDAYAQACEAQNWDEDEDSTEFEWDYNKSESSLPEPEPAPPTPPRHREQLRNPTPGLHKLGSGAQEAARSRAKAFYPYD